MDLWPAPDGRRDMPKVPCLYAGGRYTMTLWRTADGEAGEPIEDQRPWGDWSPGRWAWLLDDVKPTTERCPACWGIGATVVEGRRWPQQCRTCGGGQACDPVPARGRQGLWEWTP